MQSRFFLCFFLGTLVCALPILGQENPYQEALKTALADSVISPDEAAILGTLKNFYGIEERNTTQYQQTIEDNIIHEIVDELEKSSEYRRRAIEIRKYNETIKLDFNGLYFVDLAISGQGIPLNLDLKDPDQA